MVGQGQLGDLEWVLYLRLFITGRSRFTRSRTALRRSEDRTLASVTRAAHNPFAETPGRFPPCTAFRVARHHEEVDLASADAGRLELRNELQVPISLPARNHHIAAPGSWRFAFRELVFEVAQPRGNIGAVEPLRLKPRYKLAQKVEDLLTACLRWSG